jgi:probable HAF family extracellular repeat protein
VTATAVAAPEYSFRSLNHEGETHSAGYDLNVSANAVGACRSPTTAMFFGGSNDFRHLHPGRALGMNDSALVVGLNTDTNSAFLWDAGISNPGQPVDLLGTAGPPFPIASMAFEVNNFGQVIGFQRLIDIPGDQATLWQPSVANPHVYSTHMLGFSGHAADISEWGQIAGTYFGPSGHRGFLWTPSASNETTGTWRLLDLNTFADVTDINDVGEVVGARNGGAQAFRWDEVADQIEDLGLFAGATDAWAEGINLHGQIVGSAGTPQGDRAFIWDRTHGMRDLNTLVNPAELPVGFRLEKARNINDHGQIIGWGTLNGQTHAFLLAPLGVALDSVSLDAGGIPGNTGNRVRGFVHLTGPATTEIVVSLASDNPALARIENAAGSPITEVTIPAGAAAGEFYLRAPQAVADDTPVLVTAVHSDRVEAAVFTVEMPRVEFFLLGNSSVVGGQQTSGNLLLNGPAPAGGVTLTLTSSNPAATLNGSTLTSMTLTIPQNLNSVGFTVWTTPVAQNVIANLTLTDNRQIPVETFTATLEVRAPSVTGVSLSPSTVFGGNNTNGTVTINGAAPTGGIDVALTVPADLIAWPVDGAGNRVTSVRVPEGSTTVTFGVATVPVTTNRSVLFMATLNGTATATLTVRPAQLLGLAFSPNRVVQRQTTSLTIALTSPAPAGGANVSLDHVIPSQRRIVPLPHSVRVPAGARQTTIQITTGRVNQDAAVTVNGTYGGVTRSATVTVRRQ